MQNVANVRYSLPKHEKKNTVIYLHVGDESKPACQRCADADAVCQYVTRLTFLEKNSQTVAQDTILGTGGTASSSRGYSAVQV